MQSVMFHTDPDVNDDEQLPTISVEYGFFRYTILFRTRTLPSMSSQIVGLAKSQGGPATGDVDEEAMVATLRETRKFMGAQLAADAFS